MCYIGGMSVIGVRELRQSASEILKKVEAGEVATITVSGRAVAQIIPIKAQMWTTWQHVSRVFDSASDDTWDAERQEAGQGDLVNPWER